MTMFKVIFVIDESHFRYPDTIRTMNEYLAGIENKARKKGKTNQLLS